MKYKKEGIDSNKIEGIEFDNLFADVLASLPRWLPDLETWQEVSSGSHLWDL